MTLKALLIDLDGTLVDTMPLARTVFVEFLAKRGIKSSEEEFQCWVGPTLTEIVSGLKSQYGWSESVEELRQEYEELLLESYASTAELFPGARQCLEFAQKRGIMLALVTSAEWSIAEPILKSKGLLDCFHFVVTGDQVAAGKPHPAPYRKALEQLSCDPSSVLVMEDSEAGISSAQAAGLRCAQMALNGQEPDARVEQVFTHWHHAAVSLLNPSCTWVPTTDDFRIDVQDALPLVEPATITEVQTLWEREKLRRGEELFNGRVFCCLQMQPGRLVGAIAPYKWVLAQSIRPALQDKLKVMPVGVTGLSRSKGRLLMGKRASWVAQFPGMWEFAPAGVLEGPDWKEQVLRELAEETGLPQVGTPELQALIYDPLSHVLDLVIALDLGEEAALPEPNEEYSAFRWVDPAEASALAELCIPTAQEILARLSSR